MKITVAGVETNYHHIGKQGPVIVMLHGWGQDWQSWSPLVAKLSESYQLIIADFPAFGDSNEPPHSWNSWEYAEWLELFVNSVIPNQEFVLMGHSFGGKVASVWAGDVGKTKKTLTQLQGLVLFDSAGLPVDLTSKQQLVQKLSSAIPDFLKQSIPLTLKRRLLNSSGAATDHLNSTPAQRGILKEIVRENIASLLPTIPIPTLLIWGEHDQDTPIDKAQKFVEIIPHSTLHIIQNAGHFVFHDQPEAVLTHLLPFLKRVTSDSIK